MQSHYRKLCIVSWSFACLKPQTLITSSEHAYYFVLYLDYIFDLGVFQVPAAIKRAEQSTLGNGR